MNEDQAESIEGEGKEHVKLQLHDITERMSKLLCHYEGDKEDIKLKTGDRRERSQEKDDEKMKDGLMDVLTDFHQMANEREELLGTLMHWFEGSSKILSTADHSEDPEQSWLQVEQEMDRLLSTVESFQQPSKIADIERRLLGVVLREDNIEKIEQIRDEFNGRRLEGELGRNAASDGECNEENVDINENGRVEEMGENSNLVGEESNVRSGNCNFGKVELSEKEVQVDLMEQHKVIHEVKLEVEDTTPDDNTAATYSNVSTQTDFALKQWRAQASKNKCCLNPHNSNSVGTTNNSNIEIDTPFTNEQTERQEDAKTQIISTNENTARKDSIKIDINTKIHGIVSLDETENSCVDNAKSYISINSQIQHSTSSPTVETLPNLTPEGDTNGVSRNLTPGEKRKVPTLLPKLRCKQKTHKQKRSNAMGDVEKSSNLYNFNIQVGELSRHKVYMHLPVATTANRGLGLIPPIKERRLHTDVGLLRAFQQGMLVLSHNNARSYTTPLPVNIDTNKKKSEVRKTSFGRETQQEDLNQGLNISTHMLNLKSVRKRAITIL